MELLLMVRSAEGMRMRLSALKVVPLAMNNVPEEPMLTWLMAGNAGMRQSDPHITFLKVIDANWLGIEVAFGFDLRNEKKLGKGKSARGGVLGGANI